MNKVLFLLESLYAEGYDDGELDVSFDPSRGDSYPILLDLYTRMYDVIVDMEKNDDGQVWEGARKLLRELE